MNIMYLICTVVKWIACEYSSASRMISYHVSHVFCDYVLRLRRTYNLSLNGWHVVITRWMNIIYWCMMKVCYICNSKRPFFVLFNILHYLLYSGDHLSTIGWPKCLIFKLMFTTPSTSTPPQSLAHTAFYFGYRKKYREIWVSNERSPRVKLKSVR